MNLLCVIPARGGSERIPSKNLQILNGKSLVQLAFDCAVAADIFDAIVVSTDDPSIAANFPSIIRPPDISGPKADIADAVHHAMASVESESDAMFDYAVTLQPAIPIRKPSLIKSLVHRVVENQCGGGVTGVEVVPWLWSAEDEKAANGWFPNPYPRSQEFAGRRMWQEINAVQVSSRYNVLARRRWGLPLAIELMPSYAVLDIDTPEDLARAKIVYAKLSEAYLEDSTQAGFIIQSINGLTDHASTQ